MQFAATTLFPTFNAIHGIVADISGTLLLRREPILNPRRSKGFRVFLSSIFLAKPAKRLENEGKPLECVQRFESLISFCAFCQGLDTRKLVSLTEIRALENLRFPKIPWAHICVATWLVFAVCNVSEANIDTSADYSVWMMAAEMQAFVCTSFQTINSISQ